MIGKKIDWDKGYDVFATIRRWRYRRPRKCQSPSICPKNGVAVVNQSRRQRTAGRADWRTAVADQNKVGDAGTENDLHKRPRRCGRKGRGHRNGDGSFRSNRACRKRHGTARTVLSPRPCRGAWPGREELHVTDRQEQQLVDMLSHPEPYWSDQKLRNEATQRTYRKLQAILLPKQVDRAQEMRCRWRAPAGVSMRTSSKDWR